MGIKDIKPLEGFNWEAFENDGVSAADKTVQTAAYEGIPNNSSDNKIVKGVVTSINEREVVVRIGYKTEGIIAKSEFRYIPEMAVGDEVEVYIENQEDKKGQLVLSHKKARQSRSWERVNAALEAGEIVKGFVKCRTKGGMIVDVLGTEAFLPGSQIDVKPIRDYDIFVGKTMDFKIVKINQEFRNVVVSHKALIEAELEAQRKVFLAQLEKGQILDGIVKNITDFGVFIDLGGIDGLIHKNDLSWSHVSDPKEIVTIDSKIKVIILDFDEEKKRISLGLKQLVPLPTKLKVGAILTGSIKKVEDRFLIIQFHEFTALAPKSEMVAREYAVGDNIIGVVIENVYDEEKRRNKIVVSEKRLNELFAENHTVGSRVFARVENIYNTDGKIEVLVKCGNLLVSVPQKRFIEPYKTQLSNGELAIGSELEFEYSKYNADFRLVVFDMRPIEKARKEEEKRRRMQEKQHWLNATLQQLQKGDIVNAEVKSVNDKVAKVKIEGTEVFCTIPREELSPNKVLRASDEVFVGEIIQIAFLGYEDGELLFSRRFFVKDRYDESLYDLSLMEVLETMGIHTNRFVGKAVEINDNYFISQLISVAEVGTDDNGLLLVDPQNGQNLIAIVDNRLRNFIIPDKFYEVSLDLARKDYRKGQGTPYQFCVTSNDIKECINPYEESVSRTFKKLNSPSANKSLSYLLDEVGIGLYRSKKRMFFELLQNADDAASNNGVKVKIQVNGEYFVLTHDGYSFNKHDFYSITSAAQSTKSANKKKTGYKGIGFKSVFTNSTTVIIKSGGYMFSFDKNHPLFNDFKQFYFLSNGIENDVQRQEEFLQQNEQEYRRFNGVQEIPWQLLPIWTKDATLPIKDSIFYAKENVAIALQMDEHIILDYKDAIKEIFDEPRFMLFLRRTKRIQLKTDDEWYTIQKNIFDNGRSVTLVNSFSEKARAEYYRIITIEDIPVSDDAFANAGIPIRKAERINNRGEKESFFVRIDDKGNDGPEITGVPDRIASTDKTDISYAIELKQNGEIRLIDKGNSSFYAYLPMTEKRFSFPFYINADFIPNSNREEINTENPWNAYLFYCIGTSLVRMVKSFASENSPQYLSLLPNKEFDINSIETSLLATAFNKAYTTSLQSEAFILNDHGNLSKQDEIIIDNSGLSAVIDNDVFLSIIGTNKRLVSSVVDAGILKKSLFNLIEQVDSTDILEKLQELNDLKGYCKSLSEEDFNELLNWLHKIGESQETDISDDIINNLPCFSDGKNVLSFNEFDANNSIVLTDKTATVGAVVKYLI